MAPTIREALQQVKKELGDGTITLKSEKGPKGEVFDFLKREMVEVTAATEEEAAPASATGPDFAKHPDSSFAPHEGIGAGQQARQEPVMLKGGGICATTLARLT